MKHQLPPLPFDLPALAPLLSAETLEYHYGKHHQAYVTNLNNLIPGTPFADSTLEEIMLKATGAHYLTMRRKCGIAPFIGRVSCPRAGAILPPRWPGR